MKLPPALVAVLVVSAVVGSGCTSGDPAASTTTLTPVSTTTSTSTTTTTPTTTSVRTIIEVEFVPAPELASPGTITIDGRDLEFAFECYSEGAGDVLAIGVGTSEGRATSAQAIVQAFVGSPYVAVLEGDVVYELAIDRPAELFVQNSVIQGSALRFVEAAGSPGQGADAVLGSVGVDCQGFAFGFPEGFPVVLDPG